MSGDPGDTDGRLADPAGLRRIERIAVAWWLAALAGFAVAASIGAPTMGAATEVATVAPAGRWASLVALTLSGLASIVAFRGLQRVVAAMGPDPSEGADSQRETEEATDDETNRPRLGRVRTLALAAGRMLTLGAPVGAALFLGTESFPGLIAGYTVLPAALVTEGLLEIARTLRGKGDRDVR